MYYFLKELLCCRQVKHLNVCSSSLCSDEGLTLETRSALQIATAVDLRFQLQVADKKPSARSQVWKGQGGTMVSHKRVIDRHQRADHKELVSGGGGEGEGLPYERDGDTRRHAQGLGSQSRTLFSLRVFRTKRLYF